jgi:hypothetical protein
VFAVLNHKTFGEQKALISNHKILPAATSSLAQAKQEHQTKPADFTFY